MYKKTDKRKASPFKNFVNSHENIIQETKIVKPEFDISKESIIIIDNKIQQYYKLLLQNGDTVDETFGYEYIYYILHSFKYIDDYNRNFLKSKNFFSNSVEVDKNKLKEARIESYHKNICIKLYCNSISNLFKVKCELEFFNKLRCNEITCLSTDIKYIDEFEYQCNECNNMIYILNTNLSYKDGERFMSKQKYHPEPSLNLIHAMKMHQGQTPPQDEKEILEYVFDELKKMKIKKED